jgi:predicted DNA-binding WGR domain protein
MNCMFGIFLSIFSKNTHCQFVFIRPNPGMKLIQQTSLWFSEGNSDKIYEVDLCEVGSGQFVVNFRYGRRGTTLRDGSKTVLPVAEAQARKIYDQLVNSKTREGYREAGAAVPITVAPTPAVDLASPPDKASYLLSLLQSALSSGKLPQKAKSGPADLARGGTADSGSGPLLAGADSQERRSATVLYLLGFGPLRR